MASITSLNVGDRVILKERVTVDTAGIEADDWEKLYGEVLTVSAVEFGDYGYIQLEEDKWDREFPAKYFTPALSVKLECLI